MPRELDHTAACEHLSKMDRQLARIIARSGPCGLRVETAQNIFEALMESIVYQQLNGKVAATILGRVKALFPENTHQIRSRRGLVAGFPTPEQILAASEERLRSAGLSRAKMLAIRDLAAKTLDGTVPTLKQAQRMSDQELIDRLVDVRGIGRWTVEMLLLFRLARPDVLPVDDYGVRMGFAKMLKLTALPKPKELAAYGERWSPHRSVAAWYMWRAAEMKDLPILIVKAQKKSAGKGISAKKKSRAKSSPAKKKTRTAKKPKSAQA